MVDIGELAISRKPFGLLVAGMVLCCVAGLAHGSGVVSSPLPPPPWGTIMAEVEPHLPQ